ncbi:MAG: AbrB/MazE/SpoVT family DNA-binding domain-containing protein [Thermomicrobiales bacterium]|nr:AbrB/MazE/SpoVT family DNA-binding domain-containing protein [Thermomicrobiales bacterium]
MALPKPAPLIPPITLRARIDGSVSLPGDVVRTAGIEDGDLLEVHVENGELRIVPAGTDAPPPTSNPLAELYDYFAPARDEILASGMTEDEINAEIDLAIAEVRAEERARKT